MNSTAIKTLTTALALVASTSTLAGKVDYVDVRNSGINIQDGVVKVSAVNGKFQSTKNNTVAYHVEAKAGCENGWAVEGLHVEWGTSSCSGKVCESSQSAYSVGLGAGLQTVPFREANMQVPINKLGSDPVAMCNDLLAQKQQQGVSAMQFFNSDHVINKQATISGVAKCGRPGRNPQWGQHHMKTNLKVICESASMAGPNQIQAKKAIVAVPLGGNNQVGGGYQPLKINNGFITTNSLHYQGECPAQLDFKVNLQGVGAGAVRYHIVEGGKTTYGSPILPFTSQNGLLSHNFKINLQAEPGKINQKQNRSFRLFVEVRDGKAQGFDWSKDEFQKLNWSYTCKPKTVAPTANQKVYQTPASQPKPIGTIKAVEPDSDGEAINGGLNRDIIRRIPPQPKGATK